MREYHDQFKVLAGNMHDGAVGFASASPYSITVTSVFLFLFLMVLFFGKQITKPTIVFTATLVGMMGTFLVLDQILAGTGGISQVAACSMDIFVPIAIGIIAGMLSYRIFQCGLVLWGGMVLGAGFGNAFYYIAFGDGGFALATFTTAVFSLLGGIFMCKFQRTALIVITSAFGATMTTKYTVLLIAHKWPELTSPETFQGTDKLCLAIFMAVMFALGVVAQRYWETEKGGKRLHNTKILLLKCFADFASCFCLDSFFVTWLNGMARTRVAYDEEQRAAAAKLAPANETCKVAPVKKTSTKKGTPSKKFMKEPLIGV
jgi:hypothetical protein